MSDRKLKPEPVELLRRKLSECEGSDDPEERCPRHPDDCVCWKIHAALKGVEQKAYGRTS